jgi:hypothetical protein
MGGTMRTTLAIAIALLLSASARAAEITTGDFWGMPAIFVLGDIALGDDQIFAQQARNMPSAVVVLRSNGGKLYPALNIGKKIRAKHYWTFVGRRGTCASSCALIWAAGTHAVIQRWSFLIFHQPSMDGVTPSLDGGQMVATYLRGLGYNQIQIGYALSAPPSGGLRAMESHTAMLGIPLQPVPSLLGGWRSCTAHFCLAIP